VSLIATDNFKIIIGLGQTGMSCARFLAAKGLRFAVVDTRDEPPLAAEFRKAFPTIELRCGSLDAAFLQQANELILSPGVACALPEIQSAIAQGVSLIGDIDLFCREVTAPILAITGSNAKSTVTTLVGIMAAEAGVNVGVGGNIGTPVLDLLSEGVRHDLYVLELSSFQLETTHELKAAAATVLNISPDHLDRYTDMQAYYHAKHRIYRGCNLCVVNRDDALTQPLMAIGMSKVSFGLSAPDLKDFGLAEYEGAEWIFKGLTPILPVDSIGIKGQHNVANVMAALALGHAVNLPFDSMVKSIQSFQGLPHRCQTVAVKQGVVYVNDSKGTNVGATLAAIEGLGQQLSKGAALHVILGGVGKDQCFSELAQPLLRYARSVHLIGRDAQLIANDLQGVDVTYQTTLQASVFAASKQAQPGDIVLLSPACASFDMFSGYDHRGNVFIEAVESLP